MNGRLYRSRDDRTIAGVAGGLAAHLNIDPSIVRILWVVLVPLTGGFIILLYLVMAAIVPEQPLGDARWATWDRQWSGNWDDPAAAGPGPGPDSTSAFDAPAFADAEDPTTAFPPVSPPLPGALSSATAPDGRPPLGSRGGPLPGSAAGPSTGPNAPGSSGPGSTAPGSSAPGWRPFADDRGAPWPAHGKPSHDRGVPLIFGLVLVLVGAFFLARSYIPGIDWEASWPILLVGIGAALLIGSLRRSPRP